MSRTKIKGKKTKVPSPFDSSARKTERSAVAVMMHWMRDIIEKKGLDLGLPDVDTTGADRKSPDTIIYESRRSKNVLCVIEAKPPYYDPFDQEELKEPARKKAVQRKAKYFATTNFRRLIWFNTERVNAGESQERQIVDKYILSELENIDLIEEIRYRENIKRELERFLLKLYAVSTGKEPEPKHALDEILIFRLQEKIRKLSYYYQSVIYDQCHKDRRFSKKLRRWFNEQGWNFTWQQNDFDKAARQTAYLLGNKILFYEALRAKRPEKLDPLEIPKSLTKGSTLKTQLQGFFQEVLKIDYESIYTTDFIDHLAFPDLKEVVKEIRELVELVREYDFSTLGYDIIGRIFESLIPADERHNLGQYFTDPDVVDIIVRFCMKHEDDKVLDPACGAGTFLVRAYQHKKLMNQSLAHEEILGKLWGTDIAKFPAHLSTINLAINDLAVDKNYPNILQADFFSLLIPHQDSSVAEVRRGAKVKTLRDEERKVIYPRWFDSIVGNPPYTRQEEISKITPHEEEYKKDLIKSALLDLNGKKMADISKRAGIHAYFFVHGIKFLREGGHFRFIVSNSWLDVGYGKGLQEFFLKNYKIVSIIESKVERWFEEADINTCIVILQKCKDQKVREENLVRFVYLKKPLRYFISPAQDMWEKQIERLNEIDKLIKTILGHNEFYENDDLRIFPKSQKELWEEGTPPPLSTSPSFDRLRTVSEVEPPSGAEEIGGGVYTGSQWGKYLRAPQIFFKILEKGKGKLVPLKEIAEVRFGIKTGANEFFYLTEEEIKKKGIEKEFWMHRDELRNRIPNYVITGLDDSPSIKIDLRELGKRVLHVDLPKEQLKGKKILEHIKKGETQKFGRGGKYVPSKTVTCQSRALWYNLGDRVVAPILHPLYTGDRFLVLLNEVGVESDQNLHLIFPNYTYDPRLLIALMNSTIFHLMHDLLARQLTGALTVVGVEIRILNSIPIISPRCLSEDIKAKLDMALSNIQNRKIEHVFKELGGCSANEVSLTSVKADLRQLDALIMGEILALTEEEQLEVYRAVVDLVRSRIEKAKSFRKRKKTKEGIDIELLVKTVIEKIGENTLGKFYREKILNQEELTSRRLLKATGETKIEAGLFGWRLYSGRVHIDCSSELEARYLKIWSDVGLEKVKMPKDESYLEEVVSDLESIYQKNCELMESYLESIIDVRTQAKISDRIWQEIMT
jgi:type I restriction-modification system DNA methylase subunit